MLVRLRAIAQTNVNYNKFDITYMFLLQLYFGPNLGHEVKGLTAATLYSFRVQVYNIHREYRTFC